MIKPGKRLGKLAPRIDPRTLKLAHYLMPFPSPPTSINWGTKVPNWPMYGNDTLGDCVCAAAGHLEQLWTADASTEVTLPLSDIITMYEQVGGYVPDQPNTDNGCDMLTALKWWKTTGLAGHKIEAFVSVVYDKYNMVKSTIQLLGGVYIGLALPVCVQDATSWEVPASFDGDGAPGSWGGHCVPAVAYDAEALTVVTWGSTLRMSWRFLAAYADEAYAVLSPDWIEKTGLSPNAFNLTQLQADLARL